MTSELANTVGTLKQAAMHEVAHWWNPVPVVVPEPDPVVEPGPDCHEIRVPVPDPKTVGVGIVVCYAVYKVCKVVAGTVVAGPFGTAVCVATP